MGMSIICVGTHPYSISIQSPYRTCIKHTECTRLRHHTHTTAGSSRVAHSHRPLPLTIAFSTMRWVNERTRLSVRSAIGEIPCRAKCGAGVCAVCLVCAVLLSRNDVTMAAPRVAGD